MAATPESKVKAAVKDYLKARGIWYTMPMGTGFGVGGVPDFLCCKGGQFIGIETKAPGKRGNTSVLQKAQLTAISQAGGIALVIDDVSQLEGIV